MRIVIAGGGHAADFIARRLIREGNELVIVEKDELRCRYLESHLDAKIVQGSAASIATMRRAEIAKADMFIAVTQSDEVNLAACLIADAQAPDAYTAVRLRTHEFDTWKCMLEDLRVQVHRIVHPESDIVARILRVLAIPGVSDVRDFADGEVKVFGMNVESTSWFAGKTLQELNEVGPPGNAMIAMILRDNDVIIPHGNQTLSPGDHVYAVTTKEDLDAFFKFMGIARQKVIREVFIVGGGEVAVSLAQALEAQRVTVKLFERDVQRCDCIADLLEKTTVINADGTDQETLTQANIDGVDAFLALTGDQDANLIVSLLARRLGAKKVIPLVDRMDYLPLAQRLGFNTTVSPRLKVVDAILEFVRKGGVVSVRSFGEQNAEAIELVAPSKSRYVGRPLRKVAFPRDAIVGAIARPNGQVLVPRGDDIIAAGDRVVILAAERVVPQLESELLTTTPAKKAVWARA